MADPLLTTLCAICHTSPPKYKCPRCQIRTCSLSCTKKHKSWSECSGQRDATAYVERRQLRTAAGVDHDYNLLHGMEVALSRREKELVEERSLVQAEELRPATVQEVRWKVGRDGRRRKVIVTRALREVKGRTMERGLAHRLRQLGVRILWVPEGLERQAENKTTLNRRTGRINWQVEWLPLGSLSRNGKASTSTANERRILAKVMDDVPVYKAYHTSIEAQERAANRDRGVFVKPHRRIGLQNHSDSTWLSQLDGLQEPSTAFWLTMSDGAADISGPWPTERDREQSAQFDFFLHKPQQQRRSDLPTLVTRLDADECLREALTNNTLLEYPSVYVLTKGETLPKGFVLAARDGLPQGLKRKNEREQKTTNKKNKRRRGDGADVEEGEAAESDDNDGAYGGAVGLEAGEVMAEESFDEDEGGEEDDDDSPTSSSGSDSDDSG